MSLIIPLMFGAYIFGTRTLCDRWCGYRQRPHTSDTYITPEDGIKHENEKQVKTYIIVKQKGEWLLTLDQNTIVSNP